MVKFFKRFSFWKKVRLTLASIGIGSEVTLYMVEAYGWWKVVAGICTIVSIFITYLIKDKNHNDVVDEFEKR